MGGNVTKRLRDVVLGFAILALALLIIAKLENEQALRFAGPFAARASIRAMACSSVTSSGFTSFGSVALVVPSVT